MCLGGIFLTAAHAASEGGITHSDESAIHRPPHAQANRHPWLASVAVIDMGEGVCHPSLSTQAKFALLSSWPWMTVASSRDLCMIG